MESELCEVYDPVFVQEEKTFLLQHNMKVPDENQVLPWTHEQCDSSATYLFVIDISVCHSKIQLFATSPEFIDLEEIAHWTHCGIRRKC